MIITIVSVAAVISIALAVFGFWQMDKAKTQQAQTQKALEQVNIEKSKTSEALIEAQENLHKFEEAEEARKAKEIEQMLSDAKSYLMFGKKADAKDLLQKILVLDKDNEEAKKMLMDL